jgi:uncharacterized protein YidB (DUF937 family)
MTIDDLMQQIQETERLIAVYRNEQPGAGTSPSGIAGVLMNIVGGDGTGTPGGLSELISRFEQAGLGHIAQSWVGNAPNQRKRPV